MAWTKQILRVNLTEGTVSTEPLNMEWAQSYLGQRGLATRYLVEEVDPKADPLGPDNKLILATGPMTPGRSSWRRQPSARRERGSATTCCSSTRRAAPPTA